MAGNASSGSAVEVVGEGGGKGGRRQECDIPVLAMNVTRQRRSISCYQVPFQVLPILIHPCLQVRL